ncbi:hypothetical protein GINT2_001259 [Glugoides intestinalis]
MPVTIEQFKKNLYEDLKKHKIAKYYDKDVDMLFEKGILREEMNYKSLYNTFLLRMSSQESLFENILKNADVFDLTCYFQPPASLNHLTELEITHSLRDSFKSRANYVYVEKQNTKFFIGIKFSKDIYTPMKNQDVQELLYPYHLLMFDKNIKITDYKFDQFLIDYTKPKCTKKTYAAFIEHLKTLQLPLSIVDDDILFQSTSILPIYDVFIYLQSSSRWPKDQEAIDCAKAAFYCQLYTKSKYRNVINKQYCVFKYENLYFRIQILIKSDFTSKYRILTNLNNVIRIQDDNFHRKCHMAKKVLASFGFYPLHFDDCLVDIICLIIGSNTIGDAAFLNKFLNFHFELQGCVFNLDTLKLTRDSTFTVGLRSLRLTSKHFLCSFNLPSSAILDELVMKLKHLTIPNIGLLDDDFIIQTENVLKTDIKDYDVVLSKAPLKVFDEIIGVIPSDFNLRSSYSKDSLSKKLVKFATIYYNPCENVLMANILPGNDVDLVANLLIIETSFEYIKIRRSKAS